MLKAEFLAGMGRSFEASRNSCLGGWTAQGPASEECLRVGAQGVTTPESACAIACGKPCRKGAVL
jgi:hypothetical protein